MREIIEMFRQPAPSVLMARELEDARRSLLTAMTARDYATSMVEYHSVRIDRLRAMMDADNGVSE